MVFGSCATFALIAAVLAERLPNLSWRRTVLATALANALGGLCMHSLIAMDVVRTPWFVLMSGGLEMVTMMARQVCNLP